MFNHYMTVALRALRREKQFGIINIVGLAVALAAAILILLFIRDELSYDDWGADTDRLYRLEGSLTRQDGSRNFIALSPGRVSEPFAKDFPSEIEEISRFYQEGHLFLRGQDAFIDTVAYVEPGFFDIFDIPTLSGDRNAIFADNTSLLITESMAKKYFGNADPVGQILDPDDVDYSFKVVGVIADLPESTHLDIDFLALFEPGRYVEQPWIATYWQSHNLHTYVKLAETADPLKIEQSIPAFLDRNVDFADAPGMTPPFSDFLKMRLMPVRDIHLKSTGRFQIKPPGDMRLVISFAVIAGLIIFIACVNFINLATARASLRTREIALRKVVGARRGQLINQFMLETAITVVISLVLALAIVELALPWFNDFITKFLALDLAADPTAMLMVAGLLVVVGLGAGLHPAFHITRVRPASVLHSSGSAKMQGSKLRTALVTLQFAISIGLISVTLIVMAQTEFTRNKDLGFDIKNRLSISNMAYKSIAPVAETIKQEVEKLPGVVDTAFSRRDLPLRGLWGYSFQINGDPSGKTYNLEDMPVDADVLDFLNVQLIAGRMFDPDRALDETYTSDEGVTEMTSILNRRAVSYLGYASPEDAVGKSFSYDQAGEIQRITIVGVVEDVNMRSLRDSVEPLNFFVPKAPATVLNVKVAEGMETETQRAIELLWKRHVPAFPMNLSWYEERYGLLYQADEQRGELFGVFAVFAIFVSSIGLFSQAAYNAQRRTKEISLRKLMGASTFAVVRLMVWQFSKPVLIANLIAWPAAWLITRDWLAGFAYRIDLTPVPFLTASMIALMIAVLTVMFHAVRASNTSPALTLKHE
ncbi:ABC transporter permease [Kordiimonas aquimaris]|uniref:ABC transporter permease n=1 Tax=Kordiimonas aquimaris TaxID=707591 RepID=UPI0021D0CBA1|nr:FtsX-like permease family protein [Kordiimonas aquimaris]